MKILVTGGVGFIGSSLCANLLDRGHSVFAIDNFDPFYSRTIKFENLTELKDRPRFEFEMADINDLEALDVIFKDFQPDLVVHAAAKAGVRPSLEDPVSYAVANIQGTTSVLEVMKNNSVKRLVNCSSSSVYGRREEMMFNENMSLDSALSFYAASKQSAEIIARQYYNLYQVSVINLRFFTVYGPKQRPDLAIHKFLRAAIQAEPITLFGDGTMKRDYTYITDILFGIYGAIDRLSKQIGPIYEVYNLGNSNPVSLNELVEQIQRVTGRQLSVNYMDIPDGDVPVTFADITLAKKFLGYAPVVPLAHGLENFYAWMLNKKLYLDSSSIPLTSSSPNWSQTSSF